MKALKLLLILTIWLSVTVDAEAQCAMCKAALENSNKDLSIGVNNAIQYLMLFPYLLFFSIGFLWYRTSKKNQKKAQDL